MSPSNQLTREELLEMAELEALGGLDEYEQTFFHRAVLNAPSAVQEEIRNLQASIVADPSLLPDDEPTPELKLDVLAAVAHAIDEENEQLAPLATIGAGHRHGSSGLTASRVAFGQIHLWRAATFALAAGLLVCLFFMGKVVETNRIIARNGMNQISIQDLIDAGGPDARDITNRPHVARALSAAIDPLTGLERPVCGAVLIDDQRQVAVLYMLGLPANQVGEFRVIATDANNVEHEIGLVTKSAGQTIATTVLTHIGKILPDGSTLAAATIRIVGADGSVLVATT